MNSYKQVRVIYFKLILFGKHSKKLEVDVF